MAMVIIAAVKIMIWLIRVNKITNNSKNAKKGEQSTRHEPEWKVWLHNNIARNSARP